MQKPIIKFFILLGLFASGLPLSAQILDDSTKLLYGPHTTKIVLQSDVYNDQPQLRELDTTFNRLYNYHLTQQGNLFFQNLGNFGTPLGNLHFYPVRSIGRNFGFNVFDSYAFNSDNVEYYDAGSPYSKITYRQGSTGIQFGDAFYTRNIKPNWNAGLHLKRFTVDKTIGIVSRSDRQADHTSFLFFTRFFTKDSTYQVLSNFSVMDHKNFETGGVVQDSTETLDDLFDYQAEDRRFLNARGMEKRLAFHLYHQLKPTGPFQIFHEFDYYYQSNRFQNPNLDTSYIPGVPDSDFLNDNDSISIEDKTDFRLFKNKAGIKGYWGNLYYHFYYKRRDYSYDINCDTCADRISHYAENFIGGDLRFYVLDSAFVNVNAEYLITNDYLLNGAISSEWFSGGYSRINHSPTLLQNRFAGDRLSWENNFNNVSIDQVWAKAQLDLKWLYVQPAFSYSILNDYIYFDELAQPKQDYDLIHYTSADFLFRLNVSKFWLENLSRYAYASRVLNVPKIVNRSRFYFQSFLFKKALFLQTGFDVFYRDRYFANSYMPITQQYFINNTFETDGYFTADFFLNLKIKTVSGFVKVANLNGADYFITPWYPGYPRAFEFGVRWMFYD